MGVLMSLYFLTIPPGPQVERLILWAWNDQVGDGIVEYRNCILMFSELRDFLFGGNVPDDSAAVPWAWYEVITVDKT